ncbi:MAG: hypothetical protein JSW11_20250 [Candidatus Heimdallarchaeota archaeon]|nr:MAG: hypothetical protein JSW11_20250 [Candidatus Heimdallarchaeota archaeon]
MNNIDEKLNSIDDNQETETDPKDEPLTIAEIILFVGVPILIAVIGAAVLSIIPTSWM